MGRAKGGGANEGGGGGGDGVGGRQTGGVDKVIRTLVSIGTTKHKGIIKM